MSSFLVTGTLAACGGDDDDGGGTTADAAPPDAAPGETDAAVEGDQFLLGIRIPITDPPLDIRFITTVVFGEATADFTLQPIRSPACTDAGEESGVPVGDAVTVNDVAIGTDGSFVISTGGTIPGDANPLNCMDLTGDFEVTGTVSADLTACGTVVATALGLAIDGTFATIDIDEGTVGDDNLPPAVFACAP